MATTTTTGDQDYSTGVFVTVKKTGGCACPQCGEKFQQPDLTPCTCQNLCLYVPPGEHVHIQCPKHGDVKVYGPSVTW